MGGKVEVMVGCWGEKGDWEYRRKGVAGKNVLRWDVGSTRYQVEGEVEVYFLKEGDWGWLPGGEKVENLVESKKK